MSEETNKNGKYFCFNAYAMDQAIYSDCINMTL